MEQSDLKGKAAIVTGASSGIGAATALGLARRGANVIVNYARSETEAGNVAAEARKSGADARAVQGDVAKDEDCQRLAQAALDAWGRIDFWSTMRGRRNSSTTAIWRV
jgi:3-oxoacyl-[acyl-carrier protein] reductase